MKRLKLAPLFLLPLLLASCSVNNYKSQKQAFRACADWRDKGGKVEYTKRIVEILDPTIDRVDFDKMRIKRIKRSRWIRFCELERETNQILGGIYYKLDELIEPSRFLGGLFYWVNGLSAPTFQEYEINEYLKKTKIIKNFKY